MSALVLIGLALIVAGLALLVVRFVPRVRRQLAATATQPRTVADLVRLRTETDGAASPPPSPPTTVTAAAAVPAPVPPAARPAPPASAPPASAPAARIAPLAAARQVPTEPAPPVPAFAAAPGSAPAAPPASGRARRELEPAGPPLLPPLDGGNAPWQRGARMAAGLGGGQPWREPPPPPTPLRVVPSTEPADAAPVETAAPVRPAETAPEGVAEPDAPAGHAPVRLVPAGPAVATEAAVESPDAQAARADDPGDPIGRSPVRLVPAEAAPSAVTGIPAPAGPTAVAPEEQPASAESPAAVEPDVTGPSEVVDAGDPGVWAEPVEPASVAAAGQNQAVWIEPGAAAEPEPDGATGSPRLEGPELAGNEPADAELEVAPEREEIPIPGEWDETEPEDVPAGAVPDRFADQRPAASAEPAAGERAAGRRNRQTPDELAAEQAAADLALLRTFGFADPGLRPDSAPVVAMASPEAEEPEAAVGDAQPVRYRVIRRDGSVVGGAAVTLLDDRGGDVAAGNADAEGRGEVQAPTSGGYVLVSTAAGYQPGAVAITVADSAAEADVVLARSASVSGTVHGEDGPIAGARVTLVQDGDAVDAVDTDADGAYRIGDIGAGEYGLSVAAAGCEPVATLLDVVEEADVRHDVLLAPASPVADADGDLVGDDAMSVRR